MAKIITVKLGGKEYNVRQLPIAPSREWRQAFKGPFDAIMGAFSGLPAMQLNDVGAWGPVLTSLTETVLGSTDTLLEMLYSYSPELKAAQSTIEAEATDDEALRALWEVIKLAYPLGELVSQVKSLGERASETKPS